MTRRRRDRPDPYERAAQRMRDELQPFEPLPEALHRFNPARLGLYVLLALVAFALLRAGSDRDAPAVDGSCIRPGFAFDHHDIRAGGALRWAVAGPTGATVVVTADSTSIDDGTLVGPVVLRGCKASGVTGIPLKSGEHVLRVFLRRPDGTVQLLGSRPLEVNARR